VFPQPRRAKITVRRVRRATEEMPETLVYRVRGAKKASQDRQDCQVKPVAKVLQDLLGLAAYQDDQVLRDIQVGQADLDQTVTKAKWANVDLTDFREFLVLKDYGVKPDQTEHLENQPIYWKVRRVAKVHLA